jgi:ferredoxin-NADP reductase
VLSRVQDVLEAYRQQQKRRMPEQHTQRRESMSGTSTLDAPSFQAAQTKPNTTTVRVASISELAEGIRTFELVAPQGEPLPAFTAGAHIDVRLPGGIVRQYSLCNPPSERSRYVIAVLLEPNGRGGSRALHESVSVGDAMEISAPRNHFPLVEGARQHVFVAGGIGITPIMSMIAAAQARGDDFHLYYCTRSPQRTAFLDALQPLVERGQATLHHDEGDPSRGLDLATVLANPTPGSHLYYCGPAGFLDAVGRASAGWHDGTVHFERFGAPPPEADRSQQPQTAFEVELASSGARYTVPAGCSIVDVLSANGIEIDVSCCEGYCGTCMTRYLDGEPEHRDSVLDAEDRREFVMICCARAVTPRLVLDL